MGTAAPQSACPPAFVVGMPGRTAARGAQREDREAEPAACPPPPQASGQASSLLALRQRQVCPVAGTGPCLRLTSWSCTGSSERCPAGRPAAAQGTRPGWRPASLARAALTSSGTRGVCGPPAPGGGPASGSRWGTGRERVRLQHHRTGRPGPSTCRDRDLGAGGLG